MTTFGSSPPPTSFFFQSIYLYNARLAPTPKTQVWQFCGSLREDFKGKNETFWTKNPLLSVAVSERALSGVAVYNPRQNRSMNVG